MWIQTSATHKKFVKDASWASTFTISFVVACPYTFTEIHFTRWDCAAPETENIYSVF